MIDLSDRVAVITGAASGIGAASAATFAAHGARVVLADIDGVRVEAVAQGLRDEGFDADSRRVDICEEHDVRELISFAEARFGRLDILHNNAAAMDLVARDHGVVDLDLDVWEGTLRTNTRGPLLACKYAIPAMLRSGSGAIVNTSSISAEVGELTLTAYGASKAALSQLTRTVAAQWGKRGIRCNAVAPGLIMSPSALKLPVELQALYEKHNLTQYLGEPQDVANLVVFLASNEARYITGQVIRVDGGLVSHHPILAEFGEWVAESRPDWIAERGVA
jgi:NAD(P)-dependent dehydrogenase (short-subunit alcohol dehydrogenase family)